jgi:hypothetical protein
VPHKIEQQNKLLNENKLITACVLMCPVQDEYIQKVHISPHSHFMKLRSQTARPFAAF